MGIQMKKYQAATLQQAIELVRSDLGDNAIILQTESVKLSGPLGLGRNGVEVTAAIDRKELPRQFHATVAETADERPLTKSTSTGAKGFLKNIFGRNKTTEVKTTALTPATPTPKMAAPQFSQTPAGQSVDQLYAMKTFIEPLQREVESLKARVQQPLGTSTTPRKPRFKDPLEVEVQQLRTELSTFINEKRFESIRLPEYYRQLHQYWAQRGMTTKQIHTFFKAMEDYGNSLDVSLSNDRAVSALSTALEGAIQEADVTQKTGPRIVVLVGPTGVGKTTTIAKMAAYEKLKLKKRVALLTIDDYKIGGTDQLNHYARILEVPFGKTRNDLTLEDQCKILNADTIFIDSFGISPKDHERMDSLKKMLTFADADWASRIEMHLTLPVGIPASDVPEILEAFSELKPHYLLFTKWDETTNWGGMLSTMLSSQKPVSFICHGQNVPDDMSLFSKRTFIETVTELSNKES